jgi:hypothetical protein
MASCQLTTPLILRPTARSLFPPFIDSREQGAMLILRSLHFDELPDAARVSPIQGDLFGHHDLLAFLAARSAAS